MPIINTLITTPDNKIIVRDKIAEILLEESAGQQVLAAAAAADPRRYALRVFTERSNPWADFADVPTDPNNAPRVVNVSWDAMSYDDGASNVVGRQKGDATYQIDCFGYGQSRAFGGGHIAGDLEARQNAEWNLRLVRGFLMADVYTYLGLRGTVWRRMPSEERALDVPSDEHSAQHVAVARLTLRVGLSEFSPEFTAETIDTISLTVRRAETGEVFLTAQPQSPA